MGSNAVLPYWHYNVPVSERTDECPEYLRNLTQKDMDVISMWDCDFKVLSWEDVSRLARSNRLDLFQRTPSQMRQYRAFTYNLVRTYGSVGNFVLSHRLGWKEPVVSRGAPFEFEDDIKILYNDWPYGIDSRIVHLVIWTKFELKEDPNTGDMTQQARQEVEDFMTRTFRSRLDPEKLIWFKNWTGLKSVHTVEHFHVMMLDPNMDFVRGITKGDVPQFTLASK